MTPDPAAAFPRIDEFRFHQTLAATRGVALVFFTRAGCGSCRAWRPVLAEARRADPTLAVFEVDAGEAQALTREFNVFHLPALFLYQHGRYHCALQAEARPASLRAALVTALAAPAQEAP